jgi:predicted phage-related endonuclease
MAYIKIESEDHWRDLRMQHIGGSDVAALFYEVEIPGDGERGPQVVIQSMTDPLPPGAMPLQCLSPYKSGYRLWLEKAGKIEPDAADNERTDAGTFLEAGLAQWAMKKWPDKPIRKVRRYMTHPRIQGWGATLDYETVKGLRPVEFKNVDALVFRDQWGTDRADGGIETPPLHIMLQLQAQLGVSGRTEGDIIACVGGNTLLRTTFKLHEPTQLKIAKAIAEFWRDIALDRAPVAFADAATASDLYRFGEKDVGVELADPIFNRYCRKLITLRRQRQRIENVESILAGRIEAAMGGLSSGRATKALTSEYAISWPVVERPGMMVSKWIPDLVYRQGLRIKEIVNGKRNRN